MLLRWGTSEVLLSCGECVKRNLDANEPFYFIFNQLEQLPWILSPSLSHTKSFTTDHRSAPSFFFFFSSSQRAFFPLSRKTITSKFVFREIMTREIQPRVKSWQSERGNSEGNCRVTAKSVTVFFFFFFLLSSLFPSSLCPGCC